MKKLELDSKPASQPSYSKPVSQPASKPVSQPVNRNVGNDLGGGRLPTAGGMNRIKRLNYQLICIWFIYLYFLNRAQCVLDACNIINCN